MSGAFTLPRWTTSFYNSLLEISDKKISIILDLLKPEDILVIMTDHGNDPNIGHNRHTRENVPLLIKYGDKQGIDIGLRKSLSDIGASVCDYFNVDKPQNETSFISLLNNDGLNTFVK